MTTVKQYGARRTGTCYLFHLLKLNFADVHVLPNPLGAKHLPPDYEKIKEWKKENGQLHFTVNVRDPYSWMYGICEGMRLGRIGYERTTGLQRKLDVQRSIALQRMLIDRYNDHHLAWYSLLCQEENAAYVRFEDLLRSPQTVIYKLGHKFSLEPLNVFTDVKNEIMPGEKISDKPFDRKALYLSREYLRHMTQGQVGVVTRYTNWSLMEKFGYRRLEIEA
jgi:hypothetical protein